MKSSRQWAQGQIDEEKNDPNKAPDAGTTVRRFVAGAYAAVHDNVTSTAELVGTLDKAIQGDEAASRKVEQTAKDIGDGVVNTVRDRDAAVDKAVAAGKQAWEGFKKAPVSGTGEIIANLATYRKITRSAEDEAVVAHTGAGTTGSPKVNLKRTEIDGTKYPESAQHIIDNLKPNAKGKYRYDATVDRPGTKARRKASLRGVRRMLFKDRDEWPQAVFKEGGAGASVRHIGRSDNRGSGAALGNQLRGNKAGDYRIHDGTRIRVFVKPPKPPTP
ncbi:hypothetical protein CF165_40895 [Amycolatopsis vastitatis]|uniref:Bacterial CdiA-CT RNAse A domain-containing protein n=1 Tax=Amycolatopsis vastitatis TaxID=1905142 RepID=A0A229SPV6_9PSEU|nr:hypothetical protein CF165_40895 [Amycolatopsis vastitatis]